ncbi:MAG TPA: FMN-binding protein [Hyphomicrobiales bacterium]|nr:FMN-binding protein [Hyphomicrobiales bacterium]
MADWIRLAAPLIAIPLAQPVHAVEYLSVPAAQRAAFPAATKFSELESGRSWKAFAGERLLGLFVLDHVIGKHLYIDYSVSLDTSGRILRVDILQYRESYGGEVRGEGWLSQFVGKTSASQLKVGADIRNISGATLSSLHVTEGVKRILARYGTGSR